MAYKKTKVELSPSKERLTSYATWMLGRQDYTYNKLKQKMSQRFPNSEDDIILTLDTMVDYGYINDAKFLERLICSYIESDGFGPSLIKQKLYDKGFSRQDIDEAMSSEDMQQASFEDKAIAFKIKHYGESPITDPKERNRAMGKLVRKGFSFSDANKALSFDPENDLY